MSRVVVSVATDSWILMQQRLLRGMHMLGEQTVQWTDSLPRGCPAHRTGGNMGASREHDTRPYAFKPYAMREAQALGHTSILWCDSCIVPVRPLTEIWKRVEAQGYWICRNGYNNAQWTADSAYPDLFDVEIINAAVNETMIPNFRQVNEGIEHVVATAFAVNTMSLIGREFLEQYYRYASTTRAFCGPWQNSNAPRVPNRNNRRPSGPCGPPEVLGHRHDQTAASVIAWRLGMKLEDPVWFSYEQGPETILLAKGEI